MQAQAWLALGQTDPFWQKSWSDKTTEQTQKNRIQGCGSSG